MRKAVKKSLVVKLSSPFPPSPSLNNVSIAVDLKDHLGIIGNNAAGKRSVLRGLARACTDSGLQVEVVDFETHRNIVRSQGLETVSRVLGGMRDNADIVVRFGLTSVWWRRLKSLSTGELRKVLLARAVSKNPDVLILDRPFDGLDARSRRTLLAILDEVSQTSETVQARPLVQGIKWKERTPVRMAIATHRPAQELSTKILSLLHCDHDSVHHIPRSSNHIFTEMEYDALKRLNQDSAFSKSPIDSSRTPMVLEPVLDIQRLTVFPVNAKDDILEGKDPHRPLLDRVSWCVHPREVWWLQGENGASKSVLLSCAIDNGAERLLSLASAQHAQREWTIETDLEADRRRKRPPAVTCTDSVEMVSTELHMSFLESSNSESNVESYFAKKTSNGEAMNLIMRYLNLSPHILRRSFRDLSTGEQKLVLVTGAVLARPKLLILDESCQSLDIEHRKRVARLIDHVCSSPSLDTACVFVSHHEDELPRSVTHRLVLSKGKVVSRGPFHVSAL